MTAPTDRAPADDQDDRAPPREPTIADLIPQTFSQKVGKAIGMDPDWVAPIIVICVVVLAVIGYAAYNAAFPSPPRAYTQSQAVPLEITHVEADVNKTKVSRGYKVSTPEWTVVTDIRTSYDPSGTCPNLSKAELASSQNLAALCRLAKQRNEPVTFLGDPAKEGDGSPRMLDGKPVLVARKVVYGGEEIILYAP